MLSLPPGLSLTRLLGFMSVRGSDCAGAAATSATGTVGCSGIISVGFGGAIDKASSSASKLKISVCLPPGGGRIRRDGVISWVSVTQECKIYDDVNELRSCFV